MGKVLVTAAAGAHGSIGPQLVSQLIEAGHSVKAMVRREDTRSNALQQLGAEIAVADFQSLASLRTAMADVDRAFFCYPLAEGLLRATANFCVAAREVGVKRVANVSIMLVAPDHPSPICCEHWLSEQILDWADLGAIHLRGGFFYENVLRFAATGVATDDRLYFPFAEGEAKLAWVSAKDMARAASQALFADLPAGSRLDVTDTSPLSIREVAEAIGAGVGRPVVYEAVDFAAFTSQIEDQLGDNTYLRRHIGVLASAIGSGRVIGKSSDVFNQLTGRQPGGLDEFIADNISSFGRPN